MNCKRICAFLLFLIFCTNYAKSADGLSGAEEALLDSSLKVGDLRRCDFWIVPDYITKDAHRLPTVDSALANPLKSIDFADKYSRYLQKLVEDNYDEFASFAMSELNFVPYKFSAIDTRLTGKMIDEELRIKIDTSSDIINNLIAKEYISFLLQTYWATLKESSKIPSKDYEFIIRNLELALFDEYYGSNDFFDNYRRMKSSKKVVKEFYDRAKSFDKNEMAALGFSVLKSLSEVNKRYFKPEFNLSEIKSVTYNTKYGKIAIGGIEDNVYSGDYLMIIDFGGNDKYILPERTKFDAASSPVHIIVDFAGDDSYIGGKYNLAGGLFGVNIVMDYSGNDTYLSKDVSLGGALFGFSALCDYSGNDYYTSGKFTQGAAAFGVGLLIDKSGNDVYNCDSYSQGFGYVRGFGALADVSGDDVYIANSKTIDAMRYSDKYITFAQGAATGYRPYASGGIGILYDKQGSDKYEADIFGQGIGYWFGFGALIDDAGRDRYSAYQYAQGAGIHLAVGVLHDRSGDDVYVSNGVSQGCGHDLAFGALIDGFGDDKYLCESLSLGAGNANGISFFMDAAGSDAYLAKNATNTMGYSDYRRAYGSLGLFIDGSGDDTYSGQNLNGETVTKGTFGVFHDNKDLKIQNENKTQSDKPEVKPRGRNIEELFMEASAESLVDQKYVRPAINKLAGFSIKSADYLIEQMDTEFPREVIAIEESFNEMFKTDSNSVKLALQKCLKTGSSRKIGYAVRIIGKNKIYSLLPDFINFIQDKNPKIKETVLTALGDLKAQNCDSLICLAAKDSNVLVRSKAAYALAKISPVDLAYKIEPFLLDTMKVVRDNFFYNLDTEADNFLEFLYAVYVPGISIEAQTVFSKYIGKIDLPKIEYKKFKSLVNKQAIQVRTEIYRSVKKSDLDIWRDSLRDLLRSEKNQELKLLMLNNE